MIDYDEIKATAICLTALRVIQKVDYIARNKNAVKIANVIHARNGKVERLKKSKMDLCYTVELNVAKSVEKELGKVDIEATALIVFILKQNRELVSKYFKINWNIVEKLMNLRWSNPHSKMSMIKNAMNYASNFGTILDSEMEKVDSIMTDLLEKREKTV